MNDGLFPERPAPHAVELDATAPPSAPPAGPDPMMGILAPLVSSDRSAALCLLAMCQVASADGAVSIHELAIAYRDDHLTTLASEGREVAAEAGRLSLDEVQSHLVLGVLPRLIATGAVAADGEMQRVMLLDPVLGLLATDPSRVAAILRELSALPNVGTPEIQASVTAAPSVLTAAGLIKTYRGRNVVNQVRLDLRQGEIVGLLGPNGAGKTTTFYTIVGLIPPDAGEIRLDGEDITRMPMFQRARRGVGYLSQEPSIFRKLSVEENILAILETLPISRAEQLARLERLLDELNIRHLRDSKAYALSGGERRRLEITRALVTSPKFMMLDEPFAGVDPIAVHDIQGIVASLKNRGIGVLISDHNVEQTLDIVDRAYIMFDGAVKVSGTVEELVFDDTVAKVYFGPTLTARLRDRFRAERGGSPSPAASSPPVADVPPDTTSEPTA
jgi:lipopolysaccharide export system ATP-binding protein